MGVRVIETPDANDSYDEDYSTCWTSHSSDTKKDYYYQDKTKTHTNGGSPKSHFQHCVKDFIGNAKEFRIENNSKDLRIIGNNNRIRITSNTGNLQIIGNNTKLKILSNCGNIKYTGNDGRIYLGSDSQQQTVDYIGCNGVLKVVKSSDLQSSEAKSGSMSNIKTKTKTNKSSTPSKNEEAHFTPKSKSASFGGGPTSNIPKWQKIHDLFQSNTSKHRNTNNSLPNLNVNGGSKEKSFFEIKNNVTIMDNAGGNIIISNSVNVNI